VAGLVALAAVACALLPVPARQQEAADGRAPLLRLAGMPVFLLFMATVSCLQASHAMLYGFATLHWRAAGISDGMIGFLWAEGVLAEIVLFFAGALLLRWVGVGGLLLLGAAAGMLRWTAYAFSDALWLLLALQVLHAFTFGATHLGAMHFITRAVPTAWSASAQSLYTAVSGGLAMGLATALAGPLYAAAGGRAFLLSSVLATLGLVLALILARRWSGGRLVATAEEGTG
jgi:PPP family 3-phenylpropionic acid transporter